MTWTHLVIAAGLALPAYFLWTLIHEISHLLAVKLTVGLGRWEMKPWPHISEGTFVWGSFLCQPLRKPTDREDGIISLAPRLPDLAAAVLFPFLGLFEGYGLVVWGVVWGAGLVDLVVGSLGIAEVSDLRKASVKLGWNPWWLRVAGVGVVVMSVGAGTLLMLLGR